MLAHTLELDDVHPASKTHGSASLIPAAWSCARYVHASGKEFLTAVVCGYETVSRIGMALGVTSHRKRAGMPLLPAEVLAAQLPAESFWG